MKEVEVAPDNVNGLRRRRRPRSLSVVQLFCLLDKLTSVDVPNRREKLLRDVRRVSLTHEHPANPTLVTPSGTLEGFEKFDGILEAQVNQEPL